MKMMKIRQRNSRFLVLFPWWKAVISLGIPYGGKKPCLFIFVNLIQGCALEEPSGPYWCLTFDLGRLENLTFLYKSYAGHP